MVLNLKAVARTLGALLFFLGIALLLPMGVGIIYSEATWWSFGVAALLAFGVGGGTWLVLGWQKELEVRVREGFAIVALSWFVLSLVGAIPFVLGGVLGSYTDAFFETMSGFTTTGATILGGATNPNIEEIPNSFLFWRSLAHWLGGMGIIVLTLAILPMLGIGGMQLFKAEVPGPSADKLTPRVRETAKRLWLIYVGITAIEVLLLLPAMDLFDAVNHAFATMATGGFSTENGSVGQYNSAYIDWVVTAFMFLAGVNFALHYRLLRGQAITVFRDTEFKVYVAIVLVATLLITLGTWATTAQALPHARAFTTFDGYPFFVASAALRRVPSRRHHHHHRLWDGGLRGVAAPGRRRHLPPLFRRRHGRLNGWRDQGDPPRALGKEHAQGVPPARPSPGRHPGAAQRASGAAGGDAKRALLYRPLRWPYLLRDSCHCAAGAGPFERLWSGHLVRGQHRPGLRQLRPPPRTTRAYPMPGSGSSRS